MRLIQELALLISELPGIGPRQARRIVQFFLGKPAAYRDKVAAMLLKIGVETARCKECFRYDESNASGLCTTCRNPERDGTLLMVVEKDADIDTVESSGAYRGRYFVLGGLISMTEKKNAPVVRTKELFSRIEKNGVQEIIFALSTTPEGDFTTRELNVELAQRFYSSPSLKLTALGRGLSVGAEIEYADSETLRQALQGRRRDV